MQTGSGPERVTAVCEALVAGDYPAAREGVLALPRGIPESRLLERLVIEREHHPDARWLESFFRAWRLAGKPVDFSQLPPLPPALGGVTGLLALASAGNRPDDVAEQALGQIRPDASLPQRLALLPLLAVGNLGEAMAKRARKARRELLASLAADYPGELYIQATARLDEGEADEPLTQRTLDALYAAASRPRGALTVAHLYRLFQMAFSETGEVESRRRAFGDAVAVFPVQFVRPLELRIAATVRLHPELRSEAIDVVQRTATVMQAGRSSIERVLGSYLAVQGAQLEGDGARMKEAVGQLAAERGRVELAERVGLERWPIAPLAVEAIDAAATDEAAYLRRFEEG